MSIEILKEKSQQNFEVAKWAEKQSYYDVAISRYYYSEYQKIIYISKKLKFYIDPETGENSHINAIHNFVSSLEEELSDEDKVTMLNMNKLRRLRNDADYKEKTIEANDYNLAFKFTFNTIKDITNKFL